MISRKRNPVRRIAAQEPRVDRRSPAPAFGVNLTGAAHQCDQTIRTRSSAEDAGAAESELSILQIERSISPGSTDMAQCRHIHQAVDSAACSGQCPALGHQRPWLECAPVAGVDMLTPNHMGDEPRHRGCGHSSSLLRFPWPALPAGIRTVALLHPPQPRNRRT